MPSLKTAELNCEENSFDTNLQHNLIREQEFTFLLIISYPNFPFSTRKISGLLDLKLIDMV